MAQSGYPNPSFLPGYAVVCATLAMHTHRDPGGNPLVRGAYYPPLRFPQSTLDDSGHNQYGPTPTLWVMWLQLAPTQGCQELSCTENDVRMAGDTVLLTKANTIITVEGSRILPGDALDAL